MPGFAQGYLGFQEGEQERAKLGAYLQHMQSMMQNQQQQRAMQQRAMQQQMRQQALSRAAGPVLQHMLGGGGSGPQPGMEIAPPPGTNAGPQPPAPGEASAPAPSGPAAAGPAPRPAGPVAPPPYQSIPTPPGGGPGMDESDEAIGPPPGAEAAPAAPAAKGAAPAAQTAPGKREIQLSVPNALRAMAALNIPKEEQFEMLKVIEPQLTHAAQTELKLATIENKSLQLAQQYAMQQIAILQKEIAEGRKQQDTDTRKRDQERKERQGNERIAILAAKANKVAGGADKIHARDVIKDGDGNITGYNITTKSGKIIKMDADGNTLDGAQPKMSPNADKNNTRVLGGLQRELNGLSALPAPTPADKARMEELKKQIAGMNKPKPAGGGPKPAADAGAPAGIPAGSKQVGKTPDGKDVWQSPDGKKWTS